MSPVEMSPLRGSAPRPRWISSSTTTPRTTSGLGVRDGGARPQACVDDAAGGCDPTTQGDCDPWGDCEASLAAGALAGCAVGCRCLSCGAVRPHTGQSPVRRSAPGGNGVRGAAAARAWACCG